jgi:hypothetical protein
MQKWPDPSGNVLDIECQVSVMPLCLFTTLQGSYTVDLLVYYNCFWFFLICMIILPLVQFFGCNFESLPRQRDSNFWLTIPVFYVICNHIYVLCPDDILHA